MPSVLSNIGITIELGKDLDNTKQGNISRVAILDIPVVTNLFKRKLVSGLILKIRVIRKLKSAVRVLLSIVQLPYKLVGVRLLLTAQDSTVLVRLIVDDVSDLVHESRHFGFKDVQDVLKVLDLRNHDNHVLFLSLLHDLEFT